MVCIVFIPTLIFVAKISTLFINKENYLWLLETLRGDVFNTHSESLNEHVQLVKQVGKVLLTYLAITMTVFLSIVSLLPLFINMDLLIPLPYRFDKFESYYKLCHLFITGYLCINSACLDLLFLSMLGLCMAELNILEERLSNILPDTLGKYESETFNLEFLVEEYLVECIVLHDTINKYVQQLSVVLSFPLLTQYVCGSFVICYSVVQLTLMEQENTASVIKIMVYAGITFFQMAAYHWLGNEITYKSNKIIESVYLSQWYQISKKSQKTLILLMERAKRPLTIQLYKLVIVSLDSLGVIIRWSYSIFALIKARYS
ncbi:hypothetical protein Trydic_g4258 [Trypoxylus dichotomus]